MWSRSLWVVVKSDFDLPHDTLVLDLFEFCAFLSAVASSSSSSSSDPILCAVTLPVGSMWTTSSVCHRHSSQSCSECRSAEIRPRLTGRSGGEKGQTAGLLGDASSESSETFWMSNNRGATFHYKQGQKNFSSNKGQFDIYNSGIISWLSREQKCVFLRC